MSNLSLMLVIAVTLGLIGCGRGDGSAAGSSEETTATASGTASATAGLSTVGTSAGATAGTVTAGTTTATGDPAGGDQGNNPGTVPDPILGEVSSIDLSSLAGPAGFKVFAGDAVGLESFEIFAENSFVNLEFPCSGAIGHFEVVPREVVGILEPPFAGTFSWEPVDAQDDFGPIDINFETITSGDTSNQGFSGKVDNIVDGTLAVGSGLIDELLVTRIVQFDACS